MSHTKGINTEPCKVCGVVIRYKGDVARHELLHKPNGAVAMFKCTYEGCPYQTLQKSNLNTHLFTHTGEKPHACPDCDYRTADPGCLTRHRKRKHAYVPTRKTGKAKTSVGTKQSRRHDPYKRKEVDSSPSLAPASESLSEDLSVTLEPTYPTFDTLDALCGQVQDNTFSYTWDKCLFPLEETSFPLEPSTSLDFSPAVVSTALDTCSQLFGDNDYSFDVTDLFSQCPQTICPAEEYFTNSAPVSSTEDLSWIFDAATIQTAAFPLADDNGYFGLSESSCSPDYPSPTASVSSSESYFSDCATDSSFFSSSPSPSVADCSFSELLPTTFFTGSL